MEPATETKFAGRSKTIIGGLIMLINPLFALLGIDQLTQEMQNDMLTAAMQLVDQLSVLVGFVLVIYGRVKAGGVHFFTPKKE